MRKEDFAAGKMFCVERGFCPDGKEQYGSGENPGCVR